MSQQLKVNPQNIIENYHIFGYRTKNFESLSDVKNTVSVKDWKEETLGEGEEGKDFRVEMGTTSFVGKPVLFKPAFLKNPVPTYILRKFKPKPLMDHVFGALKMNSTFAVLNTKDYNLPPTGGKLIINPTLTQLQYDNIKHFNTISAMAFYQIYIGDPIGFSVSLRVTTPNLDDTTESRGVIIIPGGHNAYAFLVPWDSEYHQLVDAVPGQSGLSLQIETIYDSTTEAVALPLKVCVEECILDIQATIVKDSGGVRVPVSALNFTPQATTSQILQKIDYDNFIWNESEEEVKVNTTAQDVDSTQEQRVAEGPAETQAVIEVDKKAEPEKTNTKAVVKKDPIAHDSSLFYKVRNVAISSNNIIPITYDPLEFKANGSNLSAPFRKFLWFRGKPTSQISLANAWNTLMTVMLQAICPPQFRGAIKVVRGPSSLGPADILELGQNLVFQPIPDAFVKTPTRKRYPNTPWLRFTECDFGFTMQMFGGNRTAEITAPQVTFFLKCDNMQTAFTKTVARVATNSLAEDMALGLRQTKKNINFYIDNHENSFLLQDNYIKNESGDDQHITAAATQGLEMGQTVEGGEIENYNQDEMVTNVGTFNLLPDTPVVLEINLSTLQDARLKDISPIQDKALRFANLTPTRAGQAGPELMQYKIFGNLPTDKRANIRHVSLPADMKPEIIAFAFGISDILSLATGALGHIGGATNSGILDIPRNVIGTIGNVVSSLVTPIVNTLSGVLEGPRDRRFIKPSVEAEQTEPVAPVLMLQAENLSPGLQSVDVSVLAQMLNMAVDRFVSNRSVLPPTTPVVANSVTFTSDDAIAVYHYFVQYFSRSEEITLNNSINTRQFQNYLKFKSYFYDRKYSNRNIYNLKDILDYELPTNLATLRTNGQSHLELITKCPLFR